MRVPDTASLIRATDTQVCGITIPFLYLN